MKGANGNESRNALTNSRGLKNPPGIFNFKRSILVIFLMASFLLAIGTVSATITITGDLASGDDWDIYVYEGTDGGANPCSGTGSQDNNTSPAGGNAGDLAYDDDDDYTLSWTPGAPPVDVNVWFCEDGTKYANFTKAAIADGTTVYVDLGRIAGTCHNDLDNDYVNVCTDFNGTRLNTEGASFQVNAGTNQFSQYFAFEDGVAANTELWVLLDNDATDPCIWDETKTTGRMIDTTDPHAYENYGVAAAFDPDALAQGYGHNNFDYGWMQVFNSYLGDGNADRVSCGMAKFGDLGATEATRYSLYYDDNTDGGAKVKVKLYKASDLAGAATVNTYSDMNVLQVAGNFASLDFNILVNGDMPAELDFVNTYIGTVQYQTVDIDSTPADYNMYVDNSAAHVLQYWDAGTEKFQYTLGGAHAADDTNANIGRVSGEAHTNLESGTRGLQVYKELTCANEVDNAAGDPNYIVAPTDTAGVDYNIYFHDDIAGGQFYMHTWYNTGGTDYNTCGPTFSLANQIGTVNLAIQLSGRVPTDELMDINVDLNRDGQMDLNTDDFNSQGNYFLFTTSDADANVNADNNGGATSLSRVVDLSSDLTFNVARAYGDTHTALNDGGANDWARVFADSNCTTVLSSAEVQPLAAANPDYNVYYESQGAVATFVEATALVGANQYVSCVRFTAAGAGLVNQVNLDAQMTGQYPTGVTQVIVDTDQDGTWDSNTVSVSGATPDLTYYLYVTQDTDATADANFLAEDGNVLVSRNAVLNAAAETMDIARIWGQQHADLQTATDVFKVYSDLEGQTELSSEDANVGSGWYTQYYEVPAAGAQSAFLRVSDVVTNTYVFDVNILSVVNASAVVLPGDTDALHLTNRLVGQVPTDIKMIWAGQWDPDTNSIGFAAEVNQTDGNYRIFSEGVTDINVSADEDYSQVSGVNLSFFKDISAILHFDIDAIRGSVPWDFFGGSFETEDGGQDGACGGTYIGKHNSTTGGLDTVADAAIWDFQIYVDANGQDYNVLFCDIGTNLLLNRKKTSSTTGGVNHDLNVGKISGETLTELETAGDGADDIQVFDLNNGILLSSEAVQSADGGGVDYNVFFERFDGNVYYYLLARSDLGGTGQYNSWIKVPWGGSLTDLNTVYNIATKLYGTYGTGVGSAAVYLSGSSDWNAYSNDKPVSNDYQVYSATGGATDTAGFFAADNLGVVLLSYTADMSADNNFHVSRMTGNAHADLQETDARDNIEVYQSGITPCTTLLSSENITIAGTYTQYFKSTTLVDANIFLKVLDRNGSYDYNTCIATGSADANATSTAYNVDKKVGGYVATGLTNVQMALGTEGVVDTNSNVVTGTTPDTYNIFSAGHADTNITWYVQDSLELSRMDKDTTTAATNMFNVGKVAGDNVNANLRTATSRRDDVQVFSSLTNMTCTTALSSELEQPVNGTPDFNQFFEANSADPNDTFYYVRYTMGHEGVAYDYNTCDLNAFKLVSMEYAGADATDQVTGNVPDISAGDPDILIVACDTNQSGTPNASQVPQDRGATTDYYIHLDGGGTAAGTSDCNFYSDSAGTIEVFGETDNYALGDTLSVSLVFGETATALEGGTDTLRVCASGLPNDYTDGTCSSYSSSNTEYPGENGAAADFNVFFEQTNNTVYFIEVKDMNDFGGQTWGGGDKNFFSYHVFTSAAAGNRTDVNLEGSLTGYLFEEYNAAQPIEDVNINLMIGANAEDWNSFTFSSADGNYVLYSGGVFDLQYTKAGSITRDWTTNAGEMNDIPLNATVDTNLLNGVIVTVHDDAGNAITDATVEVLVDTSPIVVLSGCTNTTTTTCTRTGDNTAGNGSSGGYYFTGFALPQTVWVRAYKTGWETAISPSNDGAGQTVNTTTNYQITVYINDQTIEAPSLRYPGDANYLNYQTPTFTWFDVNGDEVDYNIMIDNNADFSSPLVDTNMNDGADLDYSSGEYGQLDDGLWYWKVAAVDREGVGYWSDVRSFYIDTNLPTAPVLTAVNSNNEARLTWTAGSDTTSGITYYNVYARYEADPTATTTYRIVSGLENAEYTHSPQQTGTWHFGITGVDRAGNESAISAIDHVEVDFNAPTGVTVLLEDGNLYTASTTVKLDVNATGATTCEWSIDNVTWNVITCGTSSTADILPGGDGVKTVYGRAMDGNQNVGQASDTVILDSTSPAAPTALSPIGAATTNHTSYTWNWNAGTDATSGIDYYDANLYTGTTLLGTASTPSTSVTYDLNTDGRAYTLRVTAYDNAGNNSGTLAFSAITTDWTDPSDASVIINDGNLYTTSTTVTFDINALSANACYYRWTNEIDWNGTGVTCTGQNIIGTLPAGDGVKTIHVRVADGQDNNVEVTDTIILDSTVPGTAPTATATANNNEIIVTWTTGQDTTSGIDYYSIYRKRNAAGVATSDTLIVSVAGQSYVDQPAYSGTYYYALTAVDKAGNVSAIGTEDSAAVDLNAPDSVSVVINDGNLYTVTTSATIDTNAQNATTCQYRTEDDVAWANVTCASTNNAITLSGGEGVKVVYFRAIDDAGGVTYASDTIIYDASAATAPSSLAATTVTNQAKLTWNVGVDTVSGIDYYNVYRSTASGFAPGAGTLMGTAAGTAYTDAPGATNTYYYVVRAVNNVGLEENNTTEVNASVDFNGPFAVHVTINDGNAYVNTGNVTLTVSSSGSTSCLYSVDAGANWAVANCNGNTNIALGGGDGLREACVRAIDVNQNETQACDDITVDSTAPGTPAAVFPAAAITTMGRDFEWQWAASSGTGSAIDYYRVDLSKNAVTVDTYDTTALNTRDHSRDLNNGSVYVVTVIAFDMAGNNSGTLSFSNVTIDLNSPITTVNNPKDDTNDVTPTINVTVSNAVSTCQFLLTVNSGQRFIDSSIVTASGNACDWTVPVWDTMVNNDTFSIQVTATDLAGKERTLTLPKNYAVDTTAPSVTISTPTSSSAISDTTPAVTFTAASDEVSNDVNLASILVQRNNADVTQAFSSSNCYQDGNAWSCTFDIPGGSAFVDGSQDNNIMLRVFDNSGNFTNVWVTDLNVDTTDYITLNSITAVTTTGQADDTNANGWKWDFNIAIGIGSIGSDKNYVRFKLANWTSATTSTTLYVDGNAEMVYDANVAGVETTKVYNLNTTYDTAQTVWPMWDHDVATAVIDANFYIQQRIPASILAGVYSSTYGIKTYSS